MYVFRRLVEFWSVVGVHCGTLQVKRNSKIKKKKTQWKFGKSCGNTCSRQGFSQLFRVLPNFHGFDLQFLFIINERLNSHSFLTANCYMLSKSGHRWLNINFSQLSPSVGLLISCSLSDALSKSFKHCLLLISHGFSSCLTWA